MQDLFQYNGRHLLLIIDKLIEKTNMENVAQERISPNLYSCIRLLGSQHHNYRQKVHHSLDRTRLSHKMENSQG